MSAVRLPSRRSPRALLPVRCSSPKTPSRSSISWNPMPSSAPTSSRAVSCAGRAPASRAPACSGSWKEYAAVFSSATASASRSAAGCSAGVSWRRTSASSPAAEVCRVLSNRSSRRSTTGPGASQRATARSAATRPRSPARIPAATPRRRDPAGEAPCSRASAATLPGRFGAPRRVSSPSMTSSWITKEVCSSSRAAPTWTAASCRPPPKASCAASSSTGRARFPPSVARAKACHRSPWARAGRAPGRVLPRPSRRWISRSTAVRCGRLMSRPQPWGAVPAGGCSG